MSQTQNNDDEIETGQDTIEVKKEIKSCAEKCIKKLHFNTRYKPL